MSEALLDTLTEALGAKQIITEPEALAPFLKDWRGLYEGKALAAVLPGSTEEVAAVVRACRAAGVAIVPQGGNTGLVGASIPLPSGRSIVLSLSRMDRIRALDAANFTMTVEAGCILETAQQAAAEADRLLPLSLAAEGSCRIGGNIASNAGGLNVLRYGNTRELVLGLEVVLPDGEIWNGLRALRKDNTGYDLKQLFIGSEGTLGVITAAVLRLYPRPRERAMALVGLPNAEAALSLLARARSASGDSVTMCEIISRRALEFAIKHIEAARDPLAEPHPWYLLIELAGGRGDGQIAEALETTLAEAYEAEEVADATIAASEAQVLALRNLREAVVEAQRHEGASIKHDVAVPVSRVPEFLARATEAVEALIPGVRPVPFGHIGDGNLHYNLTQPPGISPQAYLARWDEVNRVVHDIVHALDGTISAEHGVGQIKLAENERFKSPVELRMMRLVKQAFDPENLMNPGKLVSRGPE